MMQKHYPYKIEKNYSINNTFGIDAHCRYFVDYESVAELRQILEDNVFRQYPYLHIGGGSNLLFLNNFDGVVLHSKIKGIEVCGETENDVSLRVGAGEVWDEFVDFVVQQGWGGVENLSLIPGEVGAAAVQNIGAYGAEVKDVIEQVECVEVESGIVRIFTNEDCRFAYRESIFKGELKGKYIVTHVVFRLQKKPIFKFDYGNLAECFKNEATDISLQKIRSLIIKIREEKLPDPKVLGNAGSFFKNPYICIAHYEGLKRYYPDMPHYPVNDEVVKIPAGWLIEQCGWKGKNFERAAVYERQALVLVNLGGATGIEIKALSDKIMASVKNKFGIEIAPEVMMVS